MIPTLVDGNYYKVEPLINNGIDVNTIIVFRVDNTIICHRIVRVIRTRNGKIFIENKGDNCLKSDNFAVTLDMVIGIVSEKGS